MYSQLLKINVQPSVEIKLGSENESTLHIRGSDKFYYQE